MEVRIISSETYKQVCSTHADIPIFLQHWWLQQVGADFFALTLNKGNDLLAVWPLPIEKKFGITITRNPFLTPYLGPYVLRNEKIKAGKKDNYERELTYLFLNHLPDTKVWNLALQPAFKQAAAFRNSGFDVSVQQTFLMDLQQEEEKIFSLLHEDSRRVIQKKELSITNEPELASVMYEYQKKLLRKKEKNISYTLHQLQSLLNACLEKNCTALWVAKKEGVVQGMLWNVWDEERSYYLVGSKNPEVRENRAMTVLIWEAIKHSRALSKKIFDFEGSSVPGVERFFSSFGATRELYMVVKKNKSLLWKLVQALR